MKTDFTLTASYRKRFVLRTMAEALTGILLIFVLSGCVEVPYKYTATRYPLVVSRIVSDIADRMEQKGTLAATFAMIEEGEVFCTGSFGWRDKEADLLTTDATLFNFGSCAKMITTVAVMKLIDAGEVDLDEPVISYLPEFEMADTRAADITVRMLLNHSSGVPGTTQRGAVTLEPWHDDHMAIVLDNLAEDRLKADPGAFSVYCNDGFTLAEMLVARVSGKRFSQFVKDEIFTPLGMTHSQTADDPYAEGSRVAYRQALVASPYEIMNVYGSGGFSLTAPDWCLLLDMLGGGGMASNGVRVLSKASVDAMAEDQTTSNFWLSSSAGHGLGWDTVRLSTFDNLGILALVKSGGTVSYTSHVVMIPEYHLGVAISCVGNDLGVSDVAVLALGEILKRKGVLQGIPDAPDHAIEAGLPAEQRDYAGYYGLGTASLKIHFTENGELEVLKRVDGQWQPVSTGLTWRTNGRYAADGNAEESYFQEVPGYGVYLMRAAPSTTGKAPISTSPVAQKLAAFEAPAEAAAAWQARAGTWLQANTPPLSLTLTTPNRSIEMYEDLPGIVFVGGCALKVSSADEARMFLDIPSNGSRDMNDAQIREVNGAEWLRWGDLFYCPAGAVAALPAEGGASISLGEQGFTEWRRADGAASQTFGVSMTGTESRWAVYDANFTLVADSLCGDAGTLTAPAGGYVRFLGASGATFDLSSTTEK